MISARWRSIVTVLAMLAVVASPRIARAHAFPASESPRVGATEQSAPASVSITFDNPVEQMFAKLQVLDSGGAPVTAQPPALKEDRRTLTVALKPLAAGEYTVKWSVASEDGHRTEGSYTFTIAASGP
ncbi:MAG: copC domain protein [Candidatus Binatus sp.]|jgi:methionine-rich copper-binding protein CopC|nr:copC domain protein [Candidatus Binatus sp.]